MRSISTAFLLFVGGLVIVGFVLGSSISSSDWLSPTTNAAKARQIEAQTQLDTQRGILELAYLNDSFAQELEDEKADRAQRRALRELGFIIGLGVGSGALLALTVALVYYLICRGQLALAERARYGPPVRPPVTLVRPFLPAEEGSQRGRQAGAVEDGSGQAA
jgi:hypothetical protein